MTVAELLAMQRDEARRTTDELRNEVERLRAQVAVDCSQGHRLEQVERERDYYAARLLEAEREIERLRAECLDAWLGSATRR